MNHAEGPRVAIVGAGAAGLTAARLLTERGIRAIVFEREAQVGGKCRSLHYNGRAYDLGANFTTPRYERTRAIGDALGLARNPIGPRQIVSLTDEEAPDVGAIRGLLLKAAGWWYGNRRARTGVDRDGLVDLHPSVRLSFRDWLRGRGLGVMVQVFEALFTSYGYGPVVDLPAAYALKFFDPIHLDAAIRVIRGQPVTTTNDFDDGFEALWTRMVEEHTLDVRLETEVVSVVRDETGVSVTTRRGEDEQTERFDRLVLACPLQAALGFLDASPDEQRLFAQIRHFDYRVVAARTTGLTDLSTYLYPWSQRYTPGQPMAFYKPIPGDPDDVFLFYAYGDEALDDEVLLDRLRAILAGPLFKAELTEVLAVQRWTYFPHVDVDAVQAGFYDDLDALQGTRQTVYLGELLTFPLVELVIRHAEKQVARHF